MVSVEEAREWTTEEKVTIGAMLLVVAICAVIAVTIFLTLGLETIVGSISLGADLVALVGIPFGLYHAHLKLRTQRRENEEWIVDQTPILQRVLKMSEKTEPKWFRIPPRWVDFEEHIYPRRELKELMEGVRQNPVTLLHAISGAGKTTLALHLGYVLLTRERWRFVIYWDAGILGFKNPEGIIRKVHSRMARPGLSHCKALVIIDNVHLKTDLVGRCAVDLLGLFEGNMRCLLVARTTAGSVAEDRNKWDRMLSRTSAHIECLALERNAFEECVKPITESYAGALLPSDKDTRSTIFRTLRNKSKESLVILKFLLEHLGKKVGDVEEVKKADVTESIKQHYEDEVVGKIVAELEPPDCAHLKWLVRRMLLCIAIYSHMEIPANRPLLLKFLASEPVDREWSHKVLKLLSADGNLVGEWDDLLHPHLAIAEALPAVYPNEYRELQKSFERGLPAGIAGLSWPEHAIVALHIYLTQKQEQDKAAHTLARFLSHVNYAPSVGLLDYFMSRPTEFGACLAIVHPLTWVNETVMRLLTGAHDVSVERAAAVLAETIRKSDTPLLVMNGITIDWPELMQHSDIKTAVGASAPKLACEIRFPHHQWAVVSEVICWLELRQQSEVISAIAHAIAESDKPWQIIGAVSEWPELRQHSDIKTAVQASIPKVVHAILDGTVLIPPWERTGASAELSMIAGRKGLEATIRDAPSWLRRLIFWENHQVLEELMRFDIIRDDRDCQEALKKAGLYERFCATRHKAQDAAKDEQDSPNE